MDQGVLQLSSPACFSSSAAMFIYALPLRDLRIGNVSDHRLMFARSSFNRSMSFSRVTPVAAPLLFAGAADGLYERRNTIHPFAPLCGKVRFLCMSTRIKTMTRTSPSSAARVISPARGCKAMRCAAHEGRGVPKIIKTGAPFGSSFLPGCLVSTQTQCRCTSSAFFTV